MFYRTISSFLAVSIVTLAGGVATARPGDAPTADDIRVQCAVPAERDLNVTRTVHQTGLDLGVSVKVMLAGFEAGWVESHMNNLACGDRDSLGVFQQRPSMGWGTPEQIMDVRYAATQFFNHAKNSEQRNPSLAAWQIAQDVQRSCCAARYAAAEPKARAMLDEVSTTHSRFAFLSTDGHLFAKDELYGSWLDFNGGGASRMVTSGDWTGAIGNGNFYAKQGLYGSWLTMASGGQVTDIAISGERFAFVTSAGDVLGKDGVNSSWTVLWSGGASKVVLDGDRIGVLANGNFHAKQGLHGGWVTMASGGQVTDIAISGERFGFANSDKHAFVKDGQNASWVDVHSGVTGLTITPQWIGVIVGGNFLAKQGLYDTWYTMASGGGATKIVINGDWFGMIAGGNFLAKQGLYGSWMTMAAGGQATQMNITTIS